MITPGDVYMAWDDKLVRGSTNHRKQAQDVEYKATRDHEKNAKVYDLYKHLHKMCKYIGFKNMHPGVLEADDVIAFLSKKLPGHSVIVSVDQDLLQLIDESTDVYNPIKKHIISHSNFQQHQPVPIEQFVFYKAAMGDKSDNITGLNKVGPKRAVQLVSRGIDRLSPDDRAIVDRNIQLMDLNYSLQAYPGEIKLYKKQLDIRQKENEIDYTRVIDVCKQIECKDMTEDFITSLHATSNTPTVTQILS